ncbi:MAG: alcohol dehydrogenase [Paraglaciecola sp.]|jgi:alcohol dehydrogenase
MLLMSKLPNFVFQTVADIRFGAGCLQSLPGIVQQRFAATSVLLITDKGLRQAGVLDELIVLLQASKLKVTVFDDVQADPPESVIMAAAQCAAQVDVVIGAGGGSSMDTAKLAATVCMGQQPLHTMYGVDQVTSTRKPLVLIPTTAGTGSEVTPISVVTTGTSTKSGVVSSVLFGDIALLDPSLLLGLPAHITAETGVDAMVHAIEAFTSKIRKNPLSDQLALRALGLLSKHLPLSYQQGQNLEHRGGTLLGAMLAGQAFANAPVAGVHALAYPLGGIYHISHGLSNALMLPHVLRFNLDSATAAYGELADVLMPQQQSHSAEQKAASFIRYIEAFCQGLGLNQRLRDFAITQKDLPALAQAAMGQTRLLQNNPKIITFDDALSIYQQAW